MSVELHLVELERRHNALDREIEAAINHPSTDMLALSELKRRKLLLKDEIERLKGEEVH